MLRKVLWTALTTVMTSVAAGLAFRLSVKVWERFAHEPPPKSGLAGLLVQSPLKKRILGALHPHV
jgi:hypothetical protein